MDETFTSATNGTDAAGAPGARLSFDLDVDICVVGAGLAGLTVALEAARLGASVAVLEGRHVGWNASGHQLGTVMPGYGLALGDLIARIGLEDARELWSLSKEGAEFVRANATEAQIPGIAFSEGVSPASTLETSSTPSLNAIPGICASVALARPNSAPSFDSDHSSRASSRPMRAIRSPRASPEPGMTVPS